MAVFRVERNRGYTVMSNHHLRNINLSLKAKGLLSLMLSLPENWDYTTKGLAAICKDGVDCIRSAVKELEREGYVERERIRNADGKLGAIEYTILEQPRNPKQKNPVLDKPVLGNPAQYIDRTNLKKDINNKRNIVSYPIKEDAMRNDVSSCREQIKENIEFDVLQSEMPYECFLLSELLDLIVDTLCTTKDTIRISGTDHSADQVRERFLELRADHIRYVCESMKETTSKIRNIRQYLLAALYHAPTTIHSYYAAQVRHDMENNAYD